MRIKVMRALRLYLLAGLFICFSGSGLFAIERPGEELKSVGLTTELGTQVDLGISFTDSNGKAVALRELLLENRPLVIVPVYYKCPRLCGLLLNGVTELLNKLTLSPGKDFSIVTVSFDSSEGPDLARKKKQRFVSLLNDKTGEKSSGWHFLVGKEPQIETLMNQIGFHYKRDNGDFAHTAVIMILTPRGKISQYFTGVRFPVRDVRLALVEASEGNIGTVLDHVLLYCYRFDPLKGRYTWAAFGIMRAGGVLTLLLLGGLVLRLWLKEKSGSARKVGISG
ncbi:MAG: SCO family protein [Candidatus Dadabacteria bacterium]|nr:MAG: SCO family protein [Candidatus Dadabacteria bacterium]